MTSRLVEHRRGRRRIQPDGVDPEPRHHGEVIRHLPGGWKLPALVVGRESAVAHTSDNPWLAVDADELADGDGARARRVERRRVELVERGGVDEVVKVFIDEDIVNQLPPTPPARQLFTAAMLDAAVLDHDRTNVLVSFVDVPPDLFHDSKHDFRSSHNSAARRKIGRKAMVFGVLADDPYLLDKAIETGEITVCIIPQYRFQYTETLETLAEDPDGAFNSRYIMVSEDYLRDVIKANRQMFKLDGVL